MELNFEMVQRPGKYHEIAEGLSRLPQKTSHKTKEVADVDEDISAYFIFGPICNPNTKSKENKDTVGLLPTTKDLMEEQPNDLLGQNFKEVLRKDRTTIVNEGELHCRKASTDGAIQIVVSNRYRTTIVYHGDCPTLAVHSETKKVDDVLKRTYHRPRVAFGVHEFALKCKSCTRYRS